MILSVDWQLAVTVVPLNPFGGIVCVWVRVLITASSALPIGSRAAICLPACLFAIFFTLDLVIALLDAPGPAMAVPASAAISATTATMSAGDVRERMIRVIQSSLCIERRPRKSGWAPS